MNAGGVPKICKSSAPLFLALSYKMSVMNYVYVLKSHKGKRLYFGTTTDLRKRFAEHNSGRTKSTVYGRPWTLIYYEAYFSKKDAVARELQLKDYGSAYGFLRKRIKHSIDEVEKSGERRTAE